MMFSKSGISFSQGAPIFRCFCCYFQGGEWLPDVTLDMGDGQLIFDPSSFGFVPKDSIPPETGCDSWVFWKNTIPQIWGKRNGLFQMGFSRFSIFFSLVANCWGIFGSHQNSWDFWFVSFFRISLKNGRNPKMTGGDFPNLKIGASSQLTPGLEARIGEFSQKTFWWFSTAVPGQDHKQNS